MFWQHIDDIIALVLVLGCLILIFCHVDGEVKAILAMAATWCFRSGVESRKSIVEALKKKAGAVKGGPNNG